MQSAIIPDGVTSINKGALSGSMYTGITIPDSVTSIGSNAFYGCTFTKNDFINNSSLDAEENNYWGGNHPCIITDNSIL